MGLNFCFFFGYPSCTIFISQLIMIFVSETKLPHCHRLGVRRIVAVHLFCFFFGGQNCKIEGLGKRFGHSHICLVKNSLVW